MWLTSYEIMHLVVLAKCIVRAQNDISLVRVVRMVVIIYFTLVISHRLFIVIPDASDLFHPLQNINDLSNKCTSVLSVFLQVLLVNRYTSFLRWKKSLVSRSSELKVY